MRVTKPIDLELLAAELEAALVPFDGLGTSGEQPGAPGERDLFTYDADGAPAELPPEAEPVVEAHDASKPKRTAAFEAAEDEERLRLINERARTDPAYAALAELALRGKT
jgi:hypothetical protein